MRLEDKSTWHIDTLGELRKAAKKPREATVLAILFDD